MANYISTLIVCPFFVRESEKSITCEGIIKDTVDTRRFASKAAKARHEDIYCTSLAAHAICPAAQYLSKE